MSWVKKGNVLRQLVRVRPVRDYSLGLRSGGFFGFSMAVR